MRHAPARSTSKASATLNGARDLVDLSRGVSRAIRIVLLMVCKGYHAPSLGAVTLEILIIPRMPRQALDQAIQGLGK